MAAHHDTGRHTGTMDTIWPTADGLILRPFGLDDAEAVGEFSDDPELWIERRASHLTIHGFTYWAVVDPEWSHDVAGFCGLLHRRDQGTTLGYATAPEARGRGIATRAAAAVTKWAQQQGVDHYASIRPPNPASVRVLEKIGMRRVEIEEDRDGPRWIYRHEGFGSFAHG